MRYSGSPIAFSFSEERAKSSLLLTIEGDQVSTEVIPAPVWRPVKTLTGTMEELLHPENSVHTQSFTRLIVTDPARPADMSAILRRAFPHALEIQHRTQAKERGAGPVQVAAMHPLEALKDFMEVSGNRMLTGAEAAILTDVWENVRAEYEGEAK